MAQSITVDVSGLVDGFEADSADVVNPIGDLKLALEDTLNGIQEFDQIKLDNSTLTISSGAVTITKSMHFIETESAASTDDLVTINGGITGDVLAFSAFNGAHTVVVKHGTGNIRVDLEIDITLDTENQLVFGVFDGANWLVKGMGVKSLSSPTPIGSVAPNTGAFTTLSATSATIPTLGSTTLTATSATIPTLGSTTITATTVNATKLNVGSGVALTIASDAITVTSSFHILDTEAAASTDNLATINGGAAGDILFIQQANASRDITIKHGTGNIFTTTGSDFVFTTNTQIAMLLHVFGSWIKV